MNSICFITPPSIFLLDERVFVNLGILKVAAVCEKAGVHVEHLDLNGVLNYEDVVSNYQTNTKIFGITATSPQMPAVTKIVRVIRRTYKGSKIILGGPHCTLTYAAVRKERKRGVAGRASKVWQKLESDFDTIVVGDGEEAVLHAIKPDALKFIDGDNPSTALFLTNQKLDQLPLPARHLVDMPSYKYSIEGVDATSAIFQLGCPFACAFCGGRSSPMLRRVRTRTTENIISEIKHLYSTYGYKGVMIYDDELNVNKQVVHLMQNISDLGKKLGTDFRLRGFCKAELFTKEQAEVMYDAGFRWILIGFESGSERILENINKKATREDNTRALRIAHDAGLKVKALMSLGHPGESKQTISETRDWLLSEKPDDFDCTVVTPYGGSPYYDDAIQSSNEVWTYTAKNGDKLYANETDFEVDSNYYKGIAGGYKSYVFTDYIESDDLVKERDRLEDDVRSDLNIPFNPSSPGIKFEASMGQIPRHILRSTINNKE